MLKFSEHLRKNLKTKAMTQTELALRTKVSRIQMNRYCRGVTLPKFESAVRMSRILEFSLDEVVIEGDAV